MGRSVRTFRISLGSASRENVNDETIVYQSASELRISADVLIKSVCYLLSAPDASVPIPSNAGDGQTIRASELEPRQV